ncbi:MAG: ATP-binding protein [Bacteroidales bacterium]|nr:ATP-binding protein [Bacteroidales bacterium]MBR4497731.1 ATP-binding protein [Bacteroidales bacterium]MBR7035120.1 ATP-binding protein [Bacteroidales bacterium]
MYYGRLVEKEIERALQTSGAVLVAGPKFCGKTTTCMQYQKSFVKLNTKQTISMARMNPKAMLDGEKPRLIDEWQKAPDIWNQIKDDLDYKYEFGKYILTGSSTPADKSEVHHSGAGRITPVKMRPMSLWESKESKGSVSLQDLFDGGKDFSWDLNHDFMLDDVAHILCRGGWPISVLASKDIAVEITKNYWNGLFVFEDCENERFRNKKPEVLKMIVKSYARHISTEAAVSTIIADVVQNNERSMDAKTFDDYMEALKDLYVIEDMKSWNPKIRSKTSIRSTPTRHFVDTSLACRALGVMPIDLLHDLESFGLFFEDMAVRDLRIYSNVIGGDVFHYRDNTGLECDAVIHLDDGRWGAVEIKLGGDELIEAGAKSLKILQNKIIEKSDEPSPSFLMVLTAVGSSYKRDDGVYVVPINLLKP